MHKEDSLKQAIIIMLRRLSISIYKQSKNKILLNQSTRQIKSKKEPPKLNIPPIPVNLINVLFKNYSIF